MKDINLTFNAVIREKSEMSRWGDGGPVLSHMKGEVVTYGRLRTGFHIVGRPWIHHCI